MKSDRGGRTRPPETSTTPPDSDKATAARARRAKATTTSRTPPDRLALPVEEAARIIALGYLDDANQAGARLADPTDIEALHDFRVAIRRLRSGLRAYRQFLKGSVPKKSRNELRELAAATGTGRDTEVQLEWLRKQKLAPSQRIGQVWLIARLEERKQGAYDEIRKRVSTEFPGVEKRLAKRLRVYRVKIDRDAAGAGRLDFARASADLLDTFAVELRTHLDGVHSSDDEEEAHRARISAKRLRYLLEPLKGELAGCPAVISRIKLLQELLGDLHDAAVHGAELRPSVEAAAAERAGHIHDLTLAAPPTTPRPRNKAADDTSPGLLALARKVRQRRESRFSELEAAWLSGRADSFFGALHKLSERLAVSGSGGSGGPSGNR